MFELIIISGNVHGGGGGVCVCVLLLGTFVLQECQIQFLNDHYCIKLT
jgi:hypothetical protein